jgi:hypothetical protein
MAEGKVGVGGVLSNVGAEEYQFAPVVSADSRSESYALLRLPSCDTLPAAQGIREQELIRATLSCIGFARFIDEGKKS